MYSDERVVEILQKFLDELNEVLEDTDNWKRYYMLNKLRVLQKDMVDKIKLIRGK